MDIYVIYAYVILPVTAPVPLSAPHTRTVLDKLRSRNIRPISYIPVLFLHMPGWGPLRRNVDFKKKVEKFSGGKKREGKRRHAEDGMKI